MVRMPQALRKDGGLEGVEGWAHVAPSHAVLDHLELEPLVGQEPFDLIEPPAVGEHRLHLEFGDELAELAHDVTAIDTPPRRGQEMPLAGPLGVWGVIAVLGLR